MPPVADDGVREIPRSWLIPAFAVHRSALPLITARQLSVGVMVSVSGEPPVPRSFQVVPSLCASWNCALVDTLANVGPAVSNCTVNRVGENAGPSPAAAK